MALREKLYIIPAPRVASTPWLIAAPPPPRLSLTWPTLHVYPKSPLEGHLLLDLGLHSGSRMVSFYLQRPFSQIKFHWPVPGLGHGHTFLENHRPPAVYRAREPDSGDWQGELGRENRTSGRCHGVRMLVSLPVLPRDHGRLVF